MNIFKYIVDKRNKEMKEQTIKSDKNNINNIIMEIFKETEVSNLMNEEDILKSSNYISEKIKNINYVNKEINKNQAIEMAAKVLTYRILTIEDSVNNKINDKLEMFIDLLIERIPEEEWFTNPVSIEEYKVPLRI